MFQQRAWILQRANIELLRECQRYIAEQFSEKLSLAQNDLIEKIFYFSTLTTNDGFLDAVDRLRSSLSEAQYDVTQLPGNAYRPQVKAHVAAASDNSMVYRGQKLAVDTGVLGEDVTDKVKKRKVIYRGRVIEK